MGFEEKLNTVCPIAMGFEIRKIIPTLSQKCL